jgi:uncharacterized LabA/DUF88 family protein
MSRAALFVDAGYLLAGAHDVMGGPISRSAFSCRYEELLPALRAEVEAHSEPLDYLRTYWYDGARDGIPTSDHRRIADQPYVKLRLGRRNVRGQQKGVDGLIYRDLTTLARAGAVARAYIFTGDEDIRESVAAAQDLGVQVVPMSFRPTKETGRSAELVREVDEVIILDTTFWPPYFVKQHVPAAKLEPPDSQVIEDAASAFVKQWATGATPEEVRRLLEKEPWIPKDLYVQLILGVEPSTGSLKGHMESKRQLRAEFWKALKAEGGTADEDSQAESEEAEPAQT